MIGIEEMAGIDVLCSDKTGTLTLNKLTVDKNLIGLDTHLLIFWCLPQCQFSDACHSTVNFLKTSINYLFCCHEHVFTKGYDKDTVVLMAARASRIENQDVIDAAIVGLSHRARRI